MDRNRKRRLLTRTVPVLAVAGLLLGGSTVAIATTFARTGPGRGHHGPGRATALNLEVQSLDGSGNNKRHPEWGKAGGNYARVARSNYADGKSAPVAGPNTRLVSNRVFNDEHQNIFSENRVSQWGFVWGQFIDHTIGLRDAPPDDRPPPGAAANIPFDAKDPLESFTNTLGVIPFNRSNAAPGTGVRNPREQVNTVSSYVDAWAVYGGSDARLEWLREGPVDGNLRNNGPHLLMPENLLPRLDARGDPATAPEVAVDGRLRGQPNKAFVAGDVRSNENIALTATHTLFAREHNRIVDRLPNWLSAEQKFQIARRTVIAEQQYVTYTEFLPAMGIKLPAYRGYNDRVNATLTNEFATVGYRAHSMIHGEVEVEADADRYTPAQLDALRKQGVEIAQEDDELAFVIPLGVAFFNPDLVPLLQLGPLLQGIGGESEYYNDEQIDNQLRSVLFQIPVPGNPQCLDGSQLPKCFQSVIDLGAVDVERGRDHGMPTYNQLRKAYGLPPRTSFTAITGEASEAFPADQRLTAGAEIDDPQSLDFVELRDIDGNLIDPESEAAEASVVHAKRRTPLAARLKAIYGSVDKVDAFVGMVAEKHVPGAEFGELQLAIWKKQFKDLRDGDRFFYLNDPGLTAIRRAFGIDFRRTLSQIIADNTDVDRADLRDNVFLLDPTESAPVTAKSPAPAPPKSGQPLPPAQTPSGSPTKRRRRR